MLGKAATALLLLAAALAGCTSSTVNGGAGGSTTSNNPDHFTYTYGGASAGGTQSFDWQNGGTKARVTFNAGGAGGVLVRLLDATGREVYSKSYGGAGGASDVSTSATGVPGSWKIVLAVNGGGGFTLNVDRA